MTLGFLASGRGSNLQAVLDACAAGTLRSRPALVISNNSTAQALERARAVGVATLHLSSHTHPDPDDLDRAIVHALEAHGVELVILAGYMKRLGPLTLRRYQGRVVNVHPALLPRHGGQGMYGRHVHEAVLAAGDSETGVSVHLVDADYDTGEVLSQQVVPVHADDTVESLAARVLTCEHGLLVDTLVKIEAGVLTLPPTPANR